MAALYLHNALFGSQVSVPPPLLAHRSLSSISSRSVDHHSSSQYSATLHQANSQGSRSTDVSSYETAPNAGGCSESSRGPQSQQELRLTLECHPVQLQEQRNCPERLVRKRLRRLRWANRCLLFVIVAWTVQCTIRYFVASAIYTTRNRRDILIALGTCSTLAMVLIPISLLLSVSSSRSAWSLRSRRFIKKLSALLFLASFCLVIAPAVVNLALVFLWRNTSNDTSIKGRCHWDVDVAWGGTGRRCNTSTAPAWSYWLAGVILRLCLTTAVLAAHCVISYQYRITRQPSHNRTSQPHFSCWRSTSSRHGEPRAEASSFHSNDSMRSRPMLQLATGCPLIVVDPQTQVSTAIDNDKHASASSKGKDAPPSGHDLECEDPDDSDSLEDGDLADFLNQFRAAIGGSHSEDGESRSSEDPAAEDADHTLHEQRYRVPILGRSIHRMSTIESVGSKEAASVYLGDRSVHTISRPLTRSNTINASEGRSSHSGSRRTSLDAGQTLPSPVSAIMSEGLAASVPSETLNTGIEHELQTSTPTSFRGSPPPWSRGLMAPHAARLSSVEELG